MGKQRNKLLKSTEKPRSNWKALGSRGGGVGGGSGLLEGGGVDSSTTNNNTLHPGRLKTGNCNSHSKTKKFTGLIGSKCHALGIPGEGGGVVGDENQIYSSINEIQDVGVPYLPLKPLYFEVPQVEDEGEHLVEREWVYGAILDAFNKGSSRGVIIHGNQGTGKTTIALQLVEHSCFGRKSKLMKKGTPNSSPLALIELARKTVAYHFCQVDNRNMCVVSDFVHSLASQLCQVPSLSPYRTYLQENPDVLTLLSPTSCLKDPHQALVQGILDPLTQLRRKLKKFPPEDYYILIVDSIGEAESHKIVGCHGYYDTISSFLAKHFLKFPPWIKLILTVGTKELGILDMIPMPLISLNCFNDEVEEDLRKYLTQRFDKVVKGKRKGLVHQGLIPGLKTHLLQLARGCFLFLKLTIDLIEHGHLNIKPNNFKVLPISLQETFQIHCNLRFPISQGFNQVLPILSTCLAASNPLNLLEIYHSVNSLRSRDNLEWVEFLRVFKVVHGLLVKRRDGTYMFFHPSFRDWLLGKDVPNPKFECSPEIGHASIALRMLRVEHPLPPLKILDLSHHLLKAKSLLSCGGDDDKWLNLILLLSSSEDISGALTSPFNIYRTNPKVSRFLLEAGGRIHDEENVLHLLNSIGNFELVKLLEEFGF